MHLPLQVCYSNLSISTGFNSLVQGHIHDGGISDSGPVIIPLFTGVPTATNCTGNVDPDTIAHILEYPGKLFCAIVNLGQA